MDRRLNDLPHDLNCLQCTVRLSRFDARWPHDGSTVVTNKQIAPQHTQIYVICCSIHKRKYRHVMETTSYNAFSMDNCCTLTVKNLWVLRKKKPRGIFASRYKSTCRYSKKLATKNLQWFKNLLPERNLQF